MIDWDSLVLGPLEEIFGEGGRPAGKPMFYPAGAVPYEIDGVFDSAYREVELVDPLVPSTSTQPVLGVRLSSFRAPPMQDDQVFIPSVSKRYLVTEVRPDSHGWAKLMLSEM
ncbi:hypothetical protein NJH78_05255 [Pseudomonas chlororaphis]|uniref:head-tail joining protein n=1 Tax=Pseudomonas chlororaphis TaxID=587753 RepID=UPI00209BA171|nr:hypothetical protein [Pseudomonas chlororaphis]MCO7569373.1 hypothetical protein [Pseudomonas chlororaphis]MCO7586782.1 hypothetical protein [Pseudomonas chlororaphis]